MRSEKVTLGLWRSRRTLAVLAGAALLTSHFSLLTAQTPPALLQERAEYARWLSSARTSPFAAIAQAPVGTGIRLGPRDADVPLDGVAQQRVTVRADRVMLEGGGSARPLPRGRAIPLGAYTLVATGPPGRAVLAVFGTPKVRQPPAYFAYDAAFALSVALEPPPRPGTVRVLAVDGTEVDAVEAGTVAVTLAGTTTRLTVRRIPGDDDESDLEIYFRDPTNGKGTYPAGRFVILVPLPDGRYQLDLNRARNPFCAYSAVYPCPAPWRGNTIPAPVRAGEQYSGGGLETPAAGSEK